MDDQLEDYRKTLCDGRAAAQDAYDKAILTISAGALGVALSFVKAAATPGAKVLLSAACLCFAFSALSIIYSFRTSRKGYDAQLKAVDDGDEGIYQAPPGGRHGEITELLNVAAFYSLAVGILILAMIVVLNLGR